MDASTLLADIRLMPVVVAHDVGKAVALAQTLLHAGVGAIEITLRSDQALSAISAVATSVPDIIVGAGSVTRPPQFDQVAAAGAQFAVSPGCTPALLEAATLPYLPGASTASECLALQQANYEFIKFFPAEAAGGVNLLSSLSGPLPSLRFCPTGGITAENAASYLQLNNVTCVGGSWFVPSELLLNNDHVAIATLAKHAVKVCSG